MKSVGGLYNLLLERYIVWIAVVWMVSCRYIGRTSKVWMSFCCVASVGGLDDVLLEMLGGLRLSALDDLPLENLCACRWSRYGMHVGDVMTFCWWRRSVVWMISVRIIRGTSKVWMTYVAWHRSLVWIIFW